MAKVLAYHTGTGKKQWIPEHWLNHPVLGLAWKLAPSKRDQDQTPATPPEPDLGTPETPDDEGTDLGDVFLDLGRDTLGLGEPAETDPEGDEDAQDDR